MENIWYDWYISNGGLIPRSFINRALESISTKSLQEFLENKSDFFKVINKDFHRLSRIGKKVDEVKDTHPIVRKILIDLLDFENAAPDKIGGNKLDFLASQKSNAKVVVEVKAFDERNLSNAKGGGKEGELAPHQLSRYLQSFGNRFLGPSAVGFLTNGRDWRIQDVRGNFLEFDLEALVRDCAQEDQANLVEANLKLFLFYKVFNSDRSFRRKALIESEKIWVDCYQEFRARFHKLLCFINENYKRDFDRKNAKILCVWILFIRSLEDLGVLPAMKFSIRDAYSSKQLYSRKNWDSLYLDFNRLSDFITEIISNKYTDGNDPFDSFNIKSIPKWDSFRQEIIEFLFDSDSDDPFDFGDIYSKEFGIIYVNLLENSSDKSAYFTNPDLAHLVAKSITSRFQPNQAIIDNACGSGTLLRAVYESLAKLASDSGDIRPDPLSFFGCDIEPLSVLLCRMNLWLASSKKGQELPNLDRNIIEQDVFSGWEKIENENNESICSHIWPLVSEKSSILFVGNPPWGEYSSEASAVKNGDRKPVSDKTVNSINNSLEKIGVDCKFDNMYIPFLLMPYLESHITNNVNEINYSFVLPDQVFVGAQREGLRTFLWKTITHYYAYNNNRKGHFEGSIKGDNPDPNMRFGILTGTLKKHSNQIKICFLNNRKTEKIPKRAKDLKILPLFQEAEDLNAWKEFYEKKKDILPIIWQKGEVNRKGSNREIIKKANRSTSNDRVEVLASSQGKWKQLTGKQIDLKKIASKIWKKDHLKKINMIKKNRIIVPAQLSSGSSNTFENRIKIGKNILITDVWNWIECPEEYINYVKYALESDEWARISRAIATRRCLPVGILNDLSLPFLEINEVHKAS